MTKQKPPSRLTDTMVMPPATPVGREETHAFIGACQQYCKTFLERTTKLRMKDRPDFLQKQIEQNRQWLKLLNWMEYMNRTRRAKPESLSDMTSAGGGEGNS